MAFNNIVEKDCYELARIRDVVRSTQGLDWFTVFDLKEGFYHVEIEESEKFKTAFEFKGRVFKWDSKIRLRYCNGS